MSNEDDEENLVHEVIEENPAEVVGVRDEWKQHEGWHRKEDVLGRQATKLRGSKTDQTKRERHTSQRIVDTNDKHESEKERVRTMTMEANSRLPRYLPLIARQEQRDSSMNHGAFYFIAGLFIASILSLSRFMRQKKKGRST